MIDGKKLRGESGAGISRGVRCLILASLALAVCLLTLPQGAGATSAIWNGSQAGTVYSNVNNWNGPPASAPGGFPGEFASFPGPGVTSYIVNINASPPNPLLRFNFLNTLATPYTINVNGGNLIFNGQGVITPLPGLATFNIASGASLTFLSPSPNMPGLAAYVNDGTMTFAPGAQIAGSIAGSGLFNLTGTALFTGVDNTSTTVSGTIEGIGNLSKAGTGDPDPVRGQHLWPRHLPRWRHPGGRQQFGRRLWPLRHGYSEHHQRRPASQRHPDREQPRYGGRQFFPGRRRRG